MEWVAFDQHGSNLFDLVGDDGRQYAYNVIGEFNSNESIIGKEVTLHFPEKSPFQPYVKLKEGKS